MPIMEVEVVSKKMVKPSVPTPDHLRTCKLSFFDQIAPPDHVPIIYFYNASNISNIREQLVKSLSHTLTMFYPLAGRFVLDGFYVDCNDQGVAYSEAQVNLPLDKFLVESKINIKLINDFVPRKNFGKSHSYTTPIVGLQVSFFECGGLAICMHLSHIVADGYTAAAFIKEWATTTTGLINGDQLLSSSATSFDFASLFPSRDLSVAIKPPQIPSSKKREGKIVSKRFLFNENAISTLKANVNKSDNINRPTRVQVVTSVLWKALIRLSKLPNSTLYLHLSLRGRTGIVSPILNNPSLCGNFYLQVPAKFTKEELELHELVRLFRGSLRTTLKKCSEISKADDLFMEAANNVNEVHKDMENEEVNVSLFTSMCRMPLYETEFGWGKPEWVTIPEMTLEIVFLLDTKCGTGIEAMVSLNEMDMVQFELDPSITAFTS
ncbi:acetyl-CoA-benzylalcohol acetyltransferase-like [Heracleum sosnowskyi]|uniref:Acetyl-CoA-benzylalcohol acetyltransferase-like n=1 Tax=Heracleum sosnowskyi TaxID=360622 RepID=A0AAD8IIB2_9APIA|nr:acetyl-CoA-benzylalcohol acetyltransferase-like [Heracleum sosnowskyi]